MDKNTNQEKDNGSKDEPTNDAADTKSMDMTTIQELIRKGLVQNATPEEIKDMAKHKFWQTQPVPRYEEESSTDGPIEPEDLAKVRKEPLPLIDGFIGFSPLPHGSTKQRQTLKYKLPEKTATKGLRPMSTADIPQVGDLLRRYLDRHDMAQQFDSEELKHWLLEADVTSPDKVVYSFVVEESGKITDFFSFYRLESTVIRNAKHDTIRAAYLFYYATEAAFKGDGKNKKVLQARLNELMNDALILAKNEKFDVFNALTLLDNPLFLTEQKFGAGDGKLHYYLYNYRTAPIGGGIDEGSNIDASKSGVGVVML
ncbi:hypothetical protein FH972_021164 [Carpinus fangiana]|uniref:Glycylpeptide N-tetradecanoyltransferase n=1 Tax=Carpinus fangiana TaxID=176857 RepID=A0A5N6KNX6_9ROSI|nr:hypothetical protein FH972_021164 [Carpinus fangiana]